MVLNWITLNNLEECSWQVRENTRYPDYAYENRKEHKTKYYDLDAAKKKCLELAADSDSECTGIVESSGNFYTLRSSTVMYSSQYGESLYRYICGKYLILVIYTVFKSFWPELISNPKINF